MKRTAGLILGLAGLILLSGQPLSAFACGDVITQYNYGDGLVDERTPIDDCNNPFNADTPEPFTYTLTLNNQSITAQAVIAVPEGEVVEGIFSIAKSNNFEFSPLQIFRKEGSDYREIYTTNQTSFALDDLVSGEYIAVLIYSEPPIQIFQTEPVWKQWLKSFFLPATAYAYFQSYQDVVAVPFTVSYTTPEPQGASSVLFLPGIKASRLYTDGIFGTENQLWNPLVNRDVAKLAFDESGNSIESIYTRDIIDSVIGFGSIYGDLSQYLDDLVQTDVIIDWEPFAYDWRYDVFDVLENGTLQGDSVDSAKRVYVQDIVRQLARDSKSGKVTIIAHSNGGLLAKALMIELEKNGEADLIDNIVFIASPQLGTPKAVASVLHGYGEELLGGYVVDDVLARKVTQYMPGPYGLIPANAYFSSNVDGPVVSFDDSETSAPYRSSYGDTINTETELFNFLVGTEGRGEAIEIEDPLKLDAFLISNAFRYRREQLDSWIAPNSIKVIEIVGTGVETEKGFYYREFLERTCEPTGAFGQTSCEMIEKVKPLPQFTLYGDGTVVGGSAEGYQGQKETWFYDLFLDDEFNHANITESDSLQDLLQNIINNSKNALEFITTERPSYANSNILIGVHSPVELVVLDGEGNQTGKRSDTIYQEIPQSSYREIAGSKYVFIPAGINYTVEVTGLAEGGYSLTLETLEANGDQSLVREIRSATSTPSTTMQFSCDGSQCSIAVIDYDGDRNPDAEHDWQQVYSVITEIIDKEVNVSSSRSSSGTRVGDRAKLGEVAGISDSSTAAELQRLYEILLQLKVILDNWPK